jgi:hypothetical protein
LPKFAYLNLGDALLVQGRTAEALAAYRVARQHCAAADLAVMRQDLAWLGRVYGDLPGHAGALACFATASSHR